MKALLDNAQIFWGAHAPRVLAIAPSRSRTFTISEKISARAPKSAREGACAPQGKI